METIKTLSLTLEQTEEFVSGLSSEETTSMGATESNTFFKRVKQSLKNGFDGLCRKIGADSSEVTPSMAETVISMVKEPVQEVKSAETAMEKESPKNMDDYQYRCYLNSVVFGE